MQIKMPFYMTNKDWYYFDMREWRDKLTDKATKKALESYLEYQSVEIEGKTTISYEELVERTKKDLVEFQQNKTRYTFETNKYGEKMLIKVGTKSLNYDEYFNRYFSK